MSTDLIQEAQRLIGTGKPDDYIIAPTQHAAEFEAQAPSIAAVLRSGHVGISARDYEEKDQAAIEAQLDFQNLFGKSNGTVLATSLLIVLVLLTGILFPEYKWAMVGLGLLSFVGGFVGSYYLNILKQGRLLDNRMSSRARAESARLDYFVSVAKCPDKSQSGPLLDLLKLEYFVRFELDVQRNYYSLSSKKNAKAARMGLKWSSIAVAGAGAITAFAGFTSGFINPKFAAVATLGAAFTAISTFATTREDIYHHQRNAEKYARTRDALVDIYKTIDDVRLAVLKDGQKPLMDFIDAVHEQMLAEHKQWLSLEEESENAFTRLQETLKQSLNTLPSVNLKLDNQIPKPPDKPLAPQTLPAAGQKPTTGGQTPPPGGQVPPPGGQMPPAGGGAPPGP